ncbi:MAG: macro domain-containing protein, partial [Planctomycetota bacterium]
KPQRATAANVNHCLRRLRHELEAEAIKSLAIPRLATGVGGLEWQEILPMIHIHLGDLKIPVYVYSRFQKGIKAEEPAKA